MSWTWYELSNQMMYIELVWVLIVIDRFFLDLMAKKTALGDISFLLLLWYRRLCLKFTLEIGLIFFFFLHIVVDRRTLCLGLVSDMFDMSAKLWHCRYTLNLSCIRLGRKEAGIGFSLLLCCLRLYSNLLVLFYAWTWVWHLWCTFFTSPGLFS